MGRSGFGKLTIVFGEGVAKFIQHAMEESREVRFDFVRCWFGIRQHNFLATSPMDRATALQRVLLTFIVRAGYLTTSVTVKTISRAMGVFTMPRATSHIMTQTKTDPWTAHEVTLHR